MKAMTSKDIMDIIRTCSKCGVLDFKLSGLHIQFDDANEIASSPKNRSRRNSGQDQNNNPTQLELKELQEINAEIEEGMLSLIDPLEFEKRQLEGESDEAKA